MIEKRFRKYLAEGYEGKIRAICKEAGIDCSFKDGKLYVDKDDVADAKKAIKADDDIIKLPEIIGESKINEDSVDMEKHNTLNDIFQALERLNTEVDELDALDSDMDSTGAGDLHDQLTTFRKHIGALYQVLDRSGRIVPMDAQDRAGDEHRDAKRISDSVNEAVDSELMDQVIVQIKRDCDMGDYTAIEELLMSCPEDKLRGFLSEVDESAELNELKKLAGLPQLPKMDPSLGKGLDPEKGFPSSEDSVRDMLKGIKGAPKPGTPEYERMVQRLADPTLGQYDPKQDVEDFLNKPKPTLPDTPGMDDFTKRTLDNMPISRKDATDAAYKGFVGSNNSSIQNLRRRAGIK